MDKTSIKSIDDGMALSDCNLSDEINNLSSLGFLSSLEEIWVGTTLLLYLQTSADFLTCNGWGLKIVEDCEYCRSFHQA